jgi:predicted dehydrogenase
MKAADAGKPVLCEKPLTVTAQEARAMAEHFAARNLPVAEGHMYRFHPQTRRVVQMVRDGAVGEVKHIVSAFTVRIPSPDNVRFVKAYGGGCLYDLGFYSLDIMRQIAGEPQSFSMFGRLNADGADISASGTLGFANGITGTLACDFESYFTQTYDVIGTTGRIHVGTGFRIEPDAATTIQYWRGNWWEGGHYEEITIPPANEYVLMVEDFADAILNRRAPEFPIADAVRGMETLEQLVQQAAAHPLP